MTEIFITIILTILSSVLGNLRSISLIKGDKLQKYFITGIDALVYICLMKNIMLSKDFTGVIIYVIGKVIAIYFTDLWIDKTEKTIYLVHLYLHNEEKDDFQVYCKKNNISCTCVEGEFNGKSRSLFIIHINKNQYNNLLDYFALKQIKPNLDISEVDVQGKIKKRTQYIKNEVI